MRRWAAALGFASLVLATSSARADDVAVCADAASRGQVLRDAKKLAAAREAFRACAQPTCPAVIRNDCAGWFRDVDALLPTVLLSARAPGGAALADVAVSVDGQPLASRLDGRAFPVDPGARVFRFEAAGAAPVVLSVVVEEGRREQPVAATMVPAVAPPPPPPPSAGRPWRTVGYVAGGLGVAGLAVGAILGAGALSAKNAHCMDDACDPGWRDQVADQARSANIAFGVGGGLLVAGAALVLVSLGSHDSKTALRAAPLLAHNAGMLVVQGGWR